MKKIFCEWCGRELKHFYLKYGNKTFCRFNNDSCIKEYLFEKFAKDIEEDVVEGDEWTSQD